MSRSRPGRTKQSATRIAPHARRRLGILLGALAAASILIVLTAGGTPLAAQSKQKKYKATRAFVVDQQTGETRMPTQQEVDEVVANLAVLGQRPAENLQQSVQASGAVVVDLDGGLQWRTARPSERLTARSKRNASSPWKRAQSSSALSKTRRRLSEVMRHEHTSPQADASPHDRTSRPSSSPPASSAPVRRNSSSSTTTRRVSGSTIPRPLRQSAAIREPR